MKDDHQSDHLEAALETPDGTFYKVIPSSFLWTSNRLSACKNNWNLVLCLSLCFSVRPFIIFNKNQSNRCQDLRLIHEDLYSPFLSFLTHCLSVLEILNLV